MKLGHVFGIFMIVVGGIFSYLASTMLNDAGMTLKIFVAGPGLITLGVAFLIFPGGNITPKESREKTKDPKTFYTEAPLLHKIMWGTFAIIGYFIGQAFMPI